MIDYTKDFFGYIGPADGYPFYVYLLLRPNGKPFYVGKGTGNRIDCHETEAKRGKCECHKCRIIRKIWRNGGEIGKQIVFATSKERTALQVEAQMIQRFRSQVVNILDSDRRLYVPTSRPPSKKERQERHLDRLARQIKRLEGNRRYTNLTGDHVERSRIDDEIEAIEMELWPPEQLRLEGI